jgi:hypothetical protein
MKWLRNDEKKMIFKLKLEVGQISNRFYHIECFKSSSGIGSYWLFVNHIIWQTRPLWIYFKNKKIDYCEYFYYTIKLADLLDTIPYCSINDAVDSCPFSRARSAGVCAT